jgi:hypothetical protein
MFTLTPVCPEPEPKSVAVVLFREGALANAEEGRELAEVYKCDPTAAFPELNSIFRELGEFSPRCG